MRWFTEASAPLKRLTVVAEKNIRSVWSDELTVSLL